MSATLPPPNSSTTELVANYCQLAKNKPVTNAPTGKTRVAVAMSGGVDSSTTALLLKQEGYDVVGVTGWLIKSGSRCCDTGMIDAARVCEQLDIEHHAVDLRELFKREIVDQFHTSYAAARTPLPCSLCNTIIKWGALFNYSQKHLQASYMATGHYARIEQTAKGPALARAKDLTKDQSYVLWSITAEQLRGTMLPLGDYTKEEIRKIANAYNLASANRPDSQDLCFIPESQTVQSYLLQFLPEAPGPFVHAITGATLGTHKGTHNYTIGQRRGIGLAAAEPLYVTGLDADTQTVYVGPKEALGSSTLTASQTNWLTEQIPTEPFEALAKIRYNSASHPAHITPLNATALKVDFHQPQSAITAGQVVAIYNPTDTYLLGGGWID